MMMLMIVLCLCAGMNVMAQSTIQSGGMTFAMGDTQSVSLIDTADAAVKDGKLVIPETITTETGEARVTAIGADALKTTVPIGVIEIPASVGAIDPANAAYLKESTVVCAKGSAADAFASGQGIAVSYTEETSDEKSGQAAAAEPIEPTITLDEIQNAFSYRAHVANIGWQPAVRLGKTAGTTGRGFGLEALEIDIGLADPSKLGISAEAHVANVGWMNPVTAGQTAGTTGRGNAIEAIKINLTGSEAAAFDLYYRVHAQNYGWLDWAKNGEKAGTEGFGYQTEAIEIAIVEKGGEAPGKTERPFVDGSLLTGGSMTYRAHSQNIGWQSDVAAGETAGREGLRMEAFQINADVDNLPESASRIDYRAHVQNVGWQGWKRDGQSAGTTGKGYRVEAIEIKPSAQMARAYDVYYRVKIAHFGWLDWAKNGQSAGSTGMSFQIEAMQAVLVPKGSEAPGETARPFVTTDYVRTLCDIEYQGHVQNIGWMDWAKNGSQIGTTGRALRLEAFQMKLGGHFAQSSGVSYQAHLQNTGWQGWKSQEQVAGETGTAKRVECFQVSLTGEAAEVYDVYYHAYVENYGWLDWAKNGQWAGTTNGGLRVEALAVALVPKGQPAPGPTARRYIKIERYPQASAVLNRIGRSLPAAFAWSAGMPYQTMATSPVLSCRQYADYGFVHYRGNCYVMAATFCEMARALGYRAFFMAGSVPSLSGGLTPHGWVEIEEPDGLWVYDPDFQHETGLNGYRVRYGQHNTWMYAGGHRVN